jgi:hypothetical protein
MMDDNGKRGKMVKGPDFDEKSGFLVINVDMDAYGYSREEVEYRGNTLQPKDELHITILSKDAADSVGSYLEDHPDDRERVRRLVEETDWKFHKTGELFYVQEEEGVETIIELVDMPELEGFFRKLSRILDEDLEVPPVHVTLYMRGTDKGIGLATQEEFENLAVEEVLDIGE